MPRIGKKLLNVYDIEVLLNTYEWGYNFMPTQGQLIKALSKFSIIDLQVNRAEIIIEFSHQLFTLENMLNFSTTFSKANELSIIGKNKLRIWWD